MTASAAPAAAPAPDTYVSVPREVQAMQFTEVNWRRLNRWLTAELGTDRFMFQVAGDVLTLHIDTPEGPRDCPPGYWVVKGTHGEFYPVAADVFAHKYMAGELP